MRSFPVGRGYRHDRYGRAPERGRQARAVDLYFDRCTGGATMRERAKHRRIVMRALSRFRSVVECTTRLAAMVAAEWMRVDWFAQISSSLRVELSLSLSLSLSRARALGAKDSQC
jgi:hypothetical protein